MNLLLNLIHRSLWRVNRTVELSLPEVTGAGFRGFLTASGSQVEGRIREGANLLGKAAPVAEGNYLRREPLSVQQPMLGAAVGWADSSLDPSRIWKSYRI